MARPVAPVAPDRPRRSARSASAARRGRARGSAARPRGSRIASVSRACASSERATTSRPDVSRSSRWTIPGRSGSPPSAPSASSPGRASRARRDPQGGRRGRRACRPRAGARPRRRSSSPSSTGVELAGLGQLDARPPPPGQPVALRPPLAVDEHRAAADEPLGERARADSGHVGEDGVEPPARVRLRDARAERCQRRRSSGRPRRTRGRGARPRRR